MTTLEQIRLIGRGPIVLVDDNDIDTMMLARCHARSSLRQGFLAFDEGRDFLDHLYATTGADIPSIVFFDINLNGMSGFEVMEEMRSHQVYRSVPVGLFYSNSDSPADTRRAAELGTVLVLKFLTVNEGVAFLEELAARS